jgi:hypothetical protein
MRIRVGAAALALTFFLSSCATSSNEESSSAAIETCQAADEEDLKLVNQGMIGSKYRVESGFIARFPPREDEPLYIVAPPYDYVLAATIRGAEGDSVVAIWGIWKYQHRGEARIFALNKQARKYSTDLAYWNDSRRGEEFTAKAEDKARILELSVDANLISCFQK